MRTLSRRVRTFPIYFPVFYVCFAVFLFVYSVIMLLDLFLGVSAAFAVKLFKSWINEKDINSVAASLRKVGMDNRLMVYS